MSLREKVFSKLPPFTVDEIGTPDSVQPLDDHRSSKTRKMNFYVLVFGW
jgi:hypothetical protein